MINLDQQAKWTQIEDKDEIFSVQISPDSSFVSSCLSDGSISLRSFATGRLSYSLQHSSPGFPVTSSRFHPTDSKILISVSADGSIKEFNIKTGASTWYKSGCMTEIYSMDFQSSGFSFCVAGDPFKCQVYDMQTKELISELCKPKFDFNATNGHSNRIYSVKFHPKEPLLFSGGWDGTIHVWDLRSAASIKSLNGPIISGDSIDASENLLIAGSWKGNEALTMWDIRTFSPLKSIKWPSAEGQALVYSVKLLYGGKFFVAGASGINQVRAFSTDPFTAVGNPLSTQGPCFSLDVTQNSSSLLVGTGNGALSIHPVISAN